jgi:hypothetical protein
LKHCIHNKHLTRSLSTSHCCPSDDHRHCLVSAGRFRSCTSNLQKQSRAPSETSQTARGGRVCSSTCRKVVNTNCPYPEYPIKRRKSPLNNARQQLCWPKHSTLASEHAAPEASGTSCELCFLVATITRANWTPSDRGGLWLGHERPKPNQKRDEDRSGVSTKLYPIGLEPTTPTACLF